MQQVTQQLLVTEVITGTGFYALTEKAKEEAVELRAVLAAEMGDSYTAAKRVVPRMVGALAYGGMVARYTNATSANTYRLWDLMMHVCICVVSYV